jgi:hypothetical protein
MASVIGVVIALLVLFVILVFVLLYAYKKQKLCFKGNIFILCIFPEKSSRGSFGIRSFSFVTYLQ